MDSKKGNRTVSGERDFYESVDSMYSERIYLLQKQFEKYSKRAARRRIILISAIVVITISGVVFFSPLFNINSLEVKGTEHISFDEVKALSSINFGEDKILFFDKKAFAIKIYDLPYTDSVRIYWRFPGKVIVDITEASAVASIRVDEGFFLVSRDGRVLEYIEASAVEEQNVTDTDTAQVFELRASDVSAGTEGYYLPDGEELKNFRLLYSALVDSSFLDKLKYVDISSEDDLKIGVYDLDVSFGSASELEYKLKMLEQIISHIGINRKGIIDLSGGSRSFFREYI